MPFWQGCPCTCKAFTAGTQMGTRPAKWHGNWSSYDPHTAPATVRMYHSVGWGGWMFDVADFDAKTSTIGLLRGGQQTGQCGKAEINGNGYYVEGVFEELDDGMEFYLQPHGTGDATLFFVPPNGTTLAELNALSVEAPVHSRVVNFRGSGDGAYVQHVRLQNLTIADSAPTFMDDWEMPSGGDWTIHRGGMVFLDGTEHVSIDGCTLSRAGGNALFLSQHVWWTSITGNTISHAGDSGIALVGSTKLMDGTGDTHPAHTIITNNLVHDVGFFSKQTAAFFKSICYNTSLRYNVFFGGPRSGVNYNDGYKGGDVMEVRGLPSHTLTNSLSHDYLRALLNPTDRAICSLGGCVRPSTMRASTVGTASPGSGRRARARASTQP